MFTIAFDRQGRSDEGDVWVEIEIERDFRDQPVRRAVVFAAGFDVGRVNGHKVSRIDQPALTDGLVVALQSVKAGTNGWFERK